MTSNHTNVDIRTDQIKVWRNDLVVTRIAPNGIIEEYPTIPISWAPGTPGDTLSTSPFTTASAPAITGRITRIGNLRHLVLDPISATTTTTSTELRLEIPVPSEDVPNGVQVFPTVVHIHHSCENVSLYTDDPLTVFANVDPSAGIFPARWIIGPNPTSVGLPNTLVLFLQIYFVTTGPVTTFNGNFPIPTMPLCGWEKTSFMYEAVGNANPSPY